MATVIGAPTRWFTLGSVVGPTLFTLVWLVLGQLTPVYGGPSLTVASHSGLVIPLSWLGIGPTGPFMNSAFVLCGLLVIGGIVGTFHTIREMGVIPRWTCIILLALSPLGLIVCGIVPMNSMLASRFPARVAISWALSLPSPRPVNPHLDATYFIVHSWLLPFPNPVHSLGFLFSVATPVLSFFAAGLFLRRLPRWRGVGSWLLLGSPLTLALAVLFFGTFNLNRAAIGLAAPSILGLGGVTNRLLMVEVQAWFAALGWLTFARSEVSVTGAAV